MRVGETHLLERFPDNSLPAGFTKLLVESQNLWEVGFLLHMAKEAAEDGAVLEGGIGALCEVGEHGVAGVTAGVAGQYLSAF